MFDIDLDQVSIDPLCVMQVSAAFALERRVLPICVADEEFYVAMETNTDVRTLADIRRVIDMPVIAKTADPQLLDNLLKRVYGGPQPTLTEDAATDAVSTVDYLLRLAFMRHASDIHFDPFEDGVRVRFRIDGELIEVMRITLARQASVVSRLKVLGDLKIDERRAPQDGAFSWRDTESFMGSVPTLDVRVATLPGHYGERVTLRLLEKESRRFTLDAVGMNETHAKEFDHVLDLPHGLLLLTGPTGSGKTTTLYAAIQRLLEKEPLNVITVENPVEYEIPGIFQTEVEGTDKVNFSKALRSILRHDPDVVMIGEIRDEESLDTAVKAALTGHLVLSTLHTNDSINAITRLANMGLERHLIAATLRLSVAQRLVRTLCPHCRVPYQLSEANVRELGEEDRLVGSTFYRSRGCVYCAGRGLRGRSGLFEFLRPDAEIAEAIANGVKEHELRRICHEKGVKSLWEDGLEKAMQGVTTLREVCRASMIV